MQPPFTDAPGYQVPYAPQPEPASSAEKAVGAIAVLLGALGVIGGCCGTIANLGSSSILEAQGQLMGQSGLPGGAQQQQIIEATRLLTEKWMPYLVVTSLGNALASSLLVAAGVMLFRAHARAATLMLAACAASACVDIAFTTVNVLQQLETSEITRELLAQPMAGAQTPGFEAGMQAGMQTALYGAVCFAVGWLLTKLTFYVVAVVVARRRQSPSNMR